MNKKRPIQRSKTLTSNLKKSNKNINVNKKVEIIDTHTPTSSNTQFSNLRNSLKQKQGELSMKKVNFEDLVNLKKNLGTPEKAFLSKDMRIQGESEFSRVSSANITDNSSKPFDGFSNIANKNIFSKIGKNSNSAMNKLKIKSFTSMVYQQGKSYFRPSIVSITTQHSNNIYQSSNNNKYVPQTPMIQNRKSFLIDNNNLNTKRNTDKNIPSTFSLNNASITKTPSLRKSNASGLKKFSIFYNGTSRTSFISIATSEDNISFNNINSMKCAVFGNHENLRKMNGKSANSTKIAIDYKEFENLEIINKKAIKLYLICSIFCILSIICSCIEIEEYLDKSTHYLNEKIKKETQNIKKEEVFEVMKYRKLSLEENIIRIFNGIFSLLSFGFFIYRNIYINNAIEKNKSMKNKKSKDVKATLFDIVFKKENKIIIIVEGVICIIFYPPFVDKTFPGKYLDVVFVVPLNTIFYFLNCLKIIPIFSFYKSYSQYNSLYSKKILYDKGIKINNNFLMRSIYTRYPLLLSLFLIVVFACLSSFFLQGIETFAYNKKTQEFNYSSENGLTYSLVKIIWISLKQFPGHLTPMIPYGKIILYFLGIIGIEFVCFLVLYLNELLDLKPQEQKAYSKLQKLFNPENKIHKAANLIKLTLQKKKLLVDFEKKKLTDNDILNEKKYVNFLREKNRFYLNKFVLTIKTSICCKNFTNEFKIASNYSLPLDDILITFQNRMLENEANANNRVDFYLDVQTLLQNMIKNNEKSIESIIKSNKIQKEVIKFLLSYYGELISKKEKSKNKMISLSEKHHNPNIDKISDKFSDKYSQKSKTKLPDLGNIEEEDMHQNYSLQKLPRVKKKTDLILNIRVTDD